MIRIIIIPLFYCFLSGIGFDGLNIPSNTKNLSLSDTGIASRSIIFYNPASTTYSNSTSVNFSSLKWIEGLNGSTFNYLNKGHLFTIHTIGADDINLYGEIPSDTPIDIIESHLLSVGFSKGVVFNNDLRVGVGVYYNYCNIFPETLQEVTYNIGFQKIFTDKIKIGLIIEDFGSKKYDIPANYGAGISYYLLKSKTELLIDYKYSENRGSGMHVGLIQPINRFTFTLGYSMYSTKSTLSSGLDIQVSKKLNFSYSILSLYKTNLGLAHYFGIEISI